MRIIIVTILFILGACEKTSSKDLFEQYMWNKRVLLAFAPQSTNQLLHEQYNIIKTNQKGFIERDIVTWIVVHDEYVMIDLKKKANLPARVFFDDFAVDKNQFTVILLGKDGGEKLKLTDEIVSDEKLFNIIDSMPMRKNEIKEQG